MAISKIKLPNNTTQDIHDSRVSGVDSYPISGSSNLVTSGGIYAQIEDRAYVNNEYLLDGANYSPKYIRGDDEKWYAIGADNAGGDEDLILATTNQIPTVDSVPTSGSTNAVSSGGVKTALDGYLPLSGGTMSNTNLVGNLNAELLAGYAAQKYYPTVAYNYTTGCFCKTSLTGTATVVYIEIFGRKHGTTTGGFYFVQARAYWYNGAFQSGYNQAVRYGESIGDITFFQYDGKLCFWFKVATGSCSFYVTCRAGSAGRNYVTEITNETIPSTATGNTVVTPTVAFSGTYLSASAPAASITSTDITNWNTAELPSVTTNNAGRSLVVNSSGEWAVGLPGGIYEYDDRRILVNTSNPLYRYKICGINRRGALVPLTITDQTSQTIVDKTPTSTAIDPARGLVYYAGTDTISNLNSSIGSLYFERSRIDTRYTFNENIDTVREVFLKGTYDGHSFTLDTTSHTSWYVIAPMATTAASVYTAVFETGSYYMLVGNTGGTANMLSLKRNNTLFYFDGTYLIPVNLDNRIPSILSGSSAPTSDQGNNGDIYIQTS